MYGNNNKMRYINRNYQKPSLQEYTKAHLWTPRTKLQKTDNTAILGNNKILIRQHKQVITDTEYKNVLFGTKLIRHFTCYPHG